MPSTALLSPFRRDVLLAILGLCLLTGPAWAAAAHVGEPTYRYETAEVTTDRGGVEYVGQDAPPGTPISAQLACSGDKEVRVCAFERLVLENRTVPTALYATNPEYNPREYGERYDYVLLNDSVYRPIYIPNRSVQNDDGLYRVDLGLESVPPERALRHASVDATNDDLSPVVIEAARTGDATAPREVEVPKTPIRLEDGTYVRVYLHSSNRDVPPLEGAGDILLTYLAPFFGILLFSWLSRRITVGYDGDALRQ